VTRRVIVPFFVMDSPSNFEVPFSAPFIGVKSFAANHAPLFVRR
jgi:hypothetical protein